MPFPEFPAFQSLLSSISREKPKEPAYQSLSLTKDIKEIHPDGRMYYSKGLELWYKKETEISVDIVIKRICAELNTMKHPSDDQIGRTILLLLTFHPQQKENAVAALNDILALKTSASVSQFHIMGTAESGLTPIFFGDFSFDQMDPKRLAYKSEKAGSDYYKLYEQTIVNRVWIERKKFYSVILNWLAFQKQVGPGYQAKYAEAVLYYFEALSAALFNDFWFQFNQQQNLHIALGHEPLLERHFREVIGSNSICIFLDIQVDGKNRGYVVPIQLGRFEMSLPNDMGKQIKDLYSYIDKHFNYPREQKGEFYETIKTFVTFIAKAYRYLAENKTDDGFLHFVIALDLLFGDKHENTKTVSNRCALLTFNKSGRNYQDQKKMLSKIYDSRSKYVHIGMSVQPQFIDQIQPICHEAIYCLLRVYRNNMGKTDPLTIELWKRKLDFAWNALEANELLAESFRLEIGLDFQNPSV
jgi:hypothetical protein